MPDKENVKKKRGGLLSKLLGMGFFRIVAIPVSLITSIVLARSLGAESFGQYSFMMTLLAVLAVPVTGGVRSILTREVAIARHDEDLDRFKSVARAAFVWVVSCSALFCMLGLLAIQLSLIPDGEKWSYLWIVIVMLPLMGLGAVRDGLLKGMKEPFWVVFLSLFLHPLFLLAIVALVFWFGELTVASGLLSQMVAMVLVLFLSWFVLTSKESFSGARQGERYATGNWIRMLLPFFFINLIKVLGTHMAMLLLGFMDTDQAVAAFRVAERGAYFVGMALVLINIVIPPYIVEAWRNHDRRKVKKILSQSALNGLLLSLPIALVFIVFGENIVGMVFGHDFKEISYLPLVILSIGQLVNVLFGAALILLAMTGFERDVVWSQLLGLIVSAGIAVALIPLWGASGAALGTVAGHFVVNVFVAYCVIKRVKIRPSFL